MNPNNLSLLTDFYQLSMAYAYWKANLHERQAAFHLFFRRPPFKGGFTIAAGLESAINFIERFHFDASDLEYLETITTENGKRYFEKAFLQMLKKLKLSVSILAVPEGSSVFPYEPIMCVEGPLLQCQLLESPLLNLINFPTLIATKSARVCLAAEGDQVMEFGLRRAQGIDGALTASRAAYIGGCSSTSNVLAGKLFHIPVQGTQAHSWVMAFDKEEEAFFEYAKIFPETSIFLVDTYNTIEGVKKAIRVGKWLKAKGKRFLGIRLDSGDLAQLSIESRKLLDRAGFFDTKIVASNELDEVVISELKRQGAKIDIWGVGTHLVTGSGQAALDGVYKLSALQDARGKWNYKIKLSEQLAKISNPGLLQIKRFSFKGMYVSDVIYDRMLGMSKDACDPFDPTKQILPSHLYESHDLLVPIFKNGKRVYISPRLGDIAKHCQEELKKLPVGIKRFLNPHVYPVGMEKNLYELKNKLVTNIRMQKTK
jgi:nicotinate phosphoribosyltransferase